MYMNIKYVDGKFYKVYIGKNNKEEYNLKYEELTEEERNQTISELFEKFNVKGKKKGKKKK